MRDVQQGPPVQLDADVDAAQVHVARDAVDPERTVDGPRARARRALRLLQRLVARVEEPDRQDGRVRAVLLDLGVVRGLPRAARAGRAGRARQLDGRRQQVRRERRQARRRLRRDARPVGARPARVVEEVVVHLHHDEVAGVDEHACAARQVVRDVSRAPTR